MRIGMILELGNDRGFPPDIRVEKEAKALSSAGHRVFILTRRFPGTASKLEFIPSLGATVVRMHIDLGPRGIFAAAVRALTMQDICWGEPIKQFVKQHGIEILHVHDLLMVPTVLKSARLLGLPVIADLHENMPAALRAYRSNLPFWERFKDAVKWNYHILRYHEARALLKCDRIIVVVPEAAERVYNYGVLNDHVVIVSNTEDETTFNFDDATADPAIIEKYKKYWTASYIGGMGPHRGLETALYAVPKVCDEITNFRFLIVGANQRNKERISDIAERLDIVDAVEVVGWQPFTKVNSYVLASDVCLVPHRDFEHTQTTVPHKLFQYMICSKPVLVSSCRPLARIVEETGAGRVFRADAPNSMAQELIWMHQHPTECKLMGNLGNKAALGPYAWREDAKRLIHLYAALQGSPGRNAEELLSNVRTEL